MNNIFCKLRSCIARYVPILVFLSLSGTIQVSAGEPESPVGEISADARPWTFWYWMQAAVSREGILADLEAMKEIGLAGAYLMPIKGVSDPPHIPEPVEQLTPRFWEMVTYAMDQADRLGLQLALHACDGFAVAGGPWVTPEMSMQKLVWSRVHVAGGEALEVQMPQPETLEHYYRDIALYAFPSLPGTAIGTTPPPPKVTSSFTEAPLDFLLDEANTEPVRQSEPGWIQYAFDKPFTCRSIRIRPHGRNYQAMRLVVESSDDGESFVPVKRLMAPRHGWQDMGVPLTWSLPATTARFFRFRFHPEGSEPGAEDLDFAKWSARLKVLSISLSARPSVDQFEGKNGSVWRLSDGGVPSAGYVSKEQILDLSANMDANGKVDAILPPGSWTLLRLGHTSTGHTNATGGAGKGLEIDKFNPRAARLQFDRWFKEAIRQVGPDLAGRVLKVFHVDSWECGSQNWSDNFVSEFRIRNGYDPMPLLPALAGVPVDDRETTEAFLLDWRRTIGALLDAGFFKTLKAEADRAGCVFSAECVAPTMVSDGMRPFGTVDIPMGEFWLRSPTHDKPNDIFDAISGGHIYGKPIIQAEAFTQLRMAWDEHPGMLKRLADRHFAMGINRLVFHVFAHNPWLDRAPGMTLDGVGLYFQRDQTWWKQGRAWIDYLSRCQELLQKGKPVVDIAVFSGDDVPSRAVLPEELIDVLPGIIGETKIARERERLRNKGLPMREIPKGVSHSANIRNPMDWLDPLSGYAYDSINRDALLRLAKVKDGRIVLPGGASYRLLVVPGDRRSAPNAGRLSLEGAEKLSALIDQGAQILFEQDPRIMAPAIANTDTRSRIEAQRKRLQDAMIHPWKESDFTRIGLPQDLIIAGISDRPIDSITWTHRRDGDQDIYFLSNQGDRLELLELSFRISGDRNLQLFDPISGTTYEQTGTPQGDSRTAVSLQLEPGASRFVLFSKHSGKVDTADFSEAWNPLNNTIADTVDGPWTVRFDPDRGGPEKPQTLEELADWSGNPNPEIRYYSGTACYTTQFNVSGTLARPLWLDLGSVHDVATVRLNNMDVATLWTAPYVVRIDPWLRDGVNTLRIDVTNTWANRLIGDEQLDPDNRVAWTTAPFRLDGSPLLPAGLLGPVTLRKSTGAMPDPVLVPFPLTRKQSTQTVPSVDMQRIYEEVKTPFKYGIILQPEEGEKIDCPNVFRHGDKWYMMFVAIKDNIGYETHLAESDDLLHWKRLGKILSFPDSGWDKWQADGGLSLFDYEWGGSARLQRYDGKYWMTYIGGHQQGYETDPLSTGVAWTLEPDKAKEWNRIEENPVLTPDQPGARMFEGATLYKTHVIWDHEKRLGYPFVMYYNGKRKSAGGHESIGMAVSNDMRHWIRFGDTHILYNKGDSRWSITGDPQITRIGDLWVMFYFGAFWKPGAFDTFACSYDMVNWTQWEGPHLIEPSEPYDREFAHKPWVIKHDGVVYHFYCAVGDSGRVIALATSREFKSGQSNP